MCICYRRLFAWLLGSDVTSNVNKVILENSKSSCDNVKITETVDQYFKIYSKNLLVSVSGFLFIFIKNL